MFTNGLIYKVNKEIDSFSGGLPKYFVRWYQNFIQNTKICIYSQIELALAIIALRPSTSIEFAYRFQVGSHESHPQ